MRQADDLSIGSDNREGVADESGALSTGLASADFHLPLFHYFTIAKNTAIASYESYTLYLPIGRINRIWLEFPKGCAGLVGFQLWRGVHQIFPLPAGQWFKSDNAVLNFAFTHDVDTEPHYVELRAYNLDDTYPHTIWIGLEMSGLPDPLTEQAEQFLRTLR